MGQASVILSIKITRDRKNKKISLDQEHYIKSLMKKYKISDVEAERITTPASDAQSLLPKESNLQEAEGNVNKYQSLLGELNWLVRGTRPQNCFTTNHLAQIACSPAERHVTAAMRLLKYSCNTKSQQLTFSLESTGKLLERPLPIGYSDSDFAGHLTRR